MKNNDRFDINSFRVPDVSHAPVYIWVWNDICTREIIDEQLEEMKNLGIRAFYILPEPKDFRPHSMPTSLSPEYLSEEFFELCAYAIDKGNSQGMKCWIYDEGGWPSGGACGKVISEHPEYAQQILNCCERSFFAGDVYKKSTDRVIAAFIGDNKIIEEGYVFSEAAIVSEYISENANGNYPDLLNKAATEYFIEITHEKYAAVTKNFTAVFTDEPKAPFKAFNKDLADKYEETYGESIFPWLPLIAGRTAVSQDNVHVLHRWYDLCSRMFCENYLAPCKKFANDHGTAFTGHLDKDHEPHGCMNGGGNFNLMRALRYFDIPGIDIIWRQLYPVNKVKNVNDMNAYNGFFPRYASSAAAQNGTKAAMSEIFGVAGPGLTYDMMRYTVGFQTVRGITIFNPFNFPLGRKEQLLAQELPVFTENQPYYRELSRFNRYVERLSYFASLGERVCETALYYPVSDFQGRLNAEKVAAEFDSLGRSLEDMTVDFDIVDDDVIRTAQISDDGYMQLGRAKYKNIIIPEGAFVPIDTQNALERFISKGGKTSRGLPALTPTVISDGKGLRAMKRIAENAEIFLLFNESEEPREYQVYLPSTVVFMPDLMNGTLQKLKTEKGILNLTLTTGETAVIMLTAEKLNSEIKREFINRFEISDNFKFRKETELCCDKNGFYNIIHSEENISVSLGDWLRYTGEAYSGSVIYETELTLPLELTGREGEIDLGDVRFTACVYLNGKLLGTALMPPYRIRIPKGVLSESNKLEIVVTNTSANWYTHTDYFNNRSINELSPYFEAELDYAKDFVSGGFYGPVVLFTE